LLLDDRRVEGPGHQDGSPLAPSVVISRPRREEAMRRPACTCVLNIRQKPSHQNGNVATRASKRWNQSDILGGWKMMRLPELVSRADTSLGSRAYRERALRSGGEVR
jgi:hypothetical protein